MFNNTNTTYDYISRLTNYVRMLKILISDKQNLFITQDLKEAYLDTIDNTLEKLQFHLGYKADNAVEPKEVSHA